MHATQASKVALLPCDGSQLPCSELVRAACSSIIAPVIYKAAVVGGLVTHDRHIAGVHHDGHTCLQVLASIDIQTPSVPVISNVTAAPFPGDADGIRELLCRQLVEPVR
jgi:malonyl CoA-acyl carrier protein transacylase